MKYIYLAMMDSEKFSWYGVGKTEEEAKMAIFNQWTNGIGSERRAKMPIEELEDWYGINVEKVKIGEGFYY